MLLKNKFFKCFIIFLISFPILLFIWHWVKDYYAIFVIKASVFVTDFIYHFKLEKFKVVKEFIFIDIAKQLFSPDGSLANMVITLKIKPSAFTFNAPLTLALFLSILPIVKINWINVLEVLLFLFLIHFAYVFTLCGLQEYNNLVQTRVISPNGFAKIFWQFGWMFTDNLLIRFEPFLVVAYIYLRKGKWFLDKKEK